MKKKILKFSLKLFVSIAFLAWIVFRVDWTEVFALLQKVQTSYIALYFLLLVSGMLISTHKWKLLAAFKGIELPFFQFFKLYLTGTFINNFMPSFVGGDAYRIYQVGKEGKKYAASASAVVMDRLTGLFGAMLLVLIFSLANFTVILEQKILLFLNVIILAAVSGVMVFFLTRQRLFWRKLVAGSRIGKIIPEKLLSFFAELAHYSIDRKILGQAMGWSVLFGVVGLAATNYVLFLALGEKINLLDYLSVIFLISFVSALPVSINNIGVKEWAYLTFFAFFGVPGALVITVAILSRLLQMLFSFLAWPMYLQNKR
jgi:uncharacterized protein (TIRG00374 family)